MTAKEFYMAVAYNAQFEVFCISDRVWKSCSREMAVEQFDSRNEFWALPVRVKKI